MPPRCTPSLPSFPISLRVQATLCNGFVRVYAKQYDDFENEVVDLLRKVRTWSLREHEAKHESHANVARNENITRRFLCAEDDDSLAFEIDGDAVRGAASQHASQHAIQHAAREAMGSTDLITC